MFDKLNANNRKLKVLIVDDVHEVLTVGLQEAGHEVLYLPDTDRNGILGNMAGVEAGLLNRALTRMVRFSFWEARGRPVRGSRAWPMA